MTEFEIFIKGCAVAQGRPRAWKCKSKGVDRIVVTDPQNSREWKNYVRYVVQCEYKGSIMEGAVILQATFCLKRPKSLSKKVVDHLKKPDLDNLIKPIKDALSGIVFCDDRQIVRMQITKGYARDDRGIGVFIKVIEKGGL